MSTTTSVVYKADLDTIRDGVKVVHEHRDAYDTTYANVVIMKWRMLQKDYAWDLRDFNTGMHSASSTKTQVELVAQLLDLLMNPVFKGHNPVPLAPPAEPEGETAK